MEIHNRDLTPTEAMADIYSRIAPLIGNALIVQAFGAFETRAVAAKKQYHGLGRLGMALVLVGTFYSIAERLILPDFPGKWFVGAGAIVAGLGGLGLQAFLHFSHAKQKWLLARFGAERVRSIAFQAYPLAHQATDTPALKTAADAFYGKALVELEAELNTGPAALELYAPDKAFAPPPCDLPQPANPDLADLAAKAFVELRLDYQQRFASSEMLRLNTVARIGETVADFLYLAGGGLAVSALIIKFALPEWNLLSAWIDFIAISAFIVGLSKIVFDAASNSVPSRARYRLYVEDLQAIGEDMAEGKLTLIELVRRTERVALTELGQFCASASRISYRL